MRLKFAASLILLGVIVVLMGSAGTAADLSSASSTTGVSTGGTTTAGTGGGGSGFTSSGNTVAIVNLDEKKSADTYMWVSGSPGSWQHKTARHIAGIKFHSSSWTDPGSPAPHVTSITHYEAIMVLPGTELGPPSSTGYGTDTTTGGVQVYGANADTGYDFDVQTSADPATSDGVIPGGRHLKYYLRITETTTFDNASPQTTVSWGSVHEFILQKLQCNDASVTTRKTYGQPNTGGELPADPNAPLRFVQYGSWDYKGGDFVGNMPGTGSDASGTARLTLFPQSGSTYDPYGGSATLAYTYAALSMYDKGKPSTTGTSGAIDVGVFAEGSLGSITASTVNWGNQWSTSAPTGSSSDITLTDGNSDDYIVFKLPMGSATSANPELYGLLLADKNEAATVSGGTQCWHYFASYQYKTEQTTLTGTFPGTDCHPRVWLVQVVS